jgi:hypothetical protein
MNYKNREIFDNIGFIIIYNSTTQIANRLRLTSIILLTHKEMKVLNDYIAISYHLKRGILKSLKYECDYNFVHFNLICTYSSFKISNIYISSQ